MKHQARHSVQQQHERMTAIVSLAPATADCDQSRKGQTLPPTVANSVCSTDETVGQLSYSLHPPPEARTATVTHSAQVMGDHKPNTYITRTRAGEETSERASSTRLEREVEQKTSRARRRLARLQTSSPRCLSLSLKHCSNPATSHRHVR